MQVALGGVVLLVLVVAIRGTLSMGRRSPDLIARWELVHEPIEPTRSCNAGVAIGVASAAWPLGRLGIEGSIIQVRTPGAAITKAAPVPDHIPSLLQIRTEDITRIARVGFLFQWFVLIEDRRQGIIGLFGPGVSRVLARSDGCPPVRSTRPALFVRSRLGRDVDPFPPEA